MKINLFRGIFIGLFMMLFFQMEAAKSRSLSNSFKVFHQDTNNGLDSISSKTLKSASRDNVYIKKYQMSKSTIFLVSSFIGGFIIIAIYSSQKEKNRRKTIIEQAFKIYKEKAKASHLSKQDKLRFIDILTSKKYQIVISIKDNSQKNFCNVQIVDLKQQTEDLYSIKLSGNDDVGKSIYEGVLSFRGDGLGMKLSKVYANRTKAEQTGKFSIILFEGEGNTEFIAGQWCYQGFQDNDNFSGTWTMLQISSKKS